MDARIQQVQEQMQELADLFNSKTDPRLSATLPTNETAAKETHLMTFTSEPPVTSTPVPTRYGVYYQSGASQPLAIGGTAAASPPQSRAIIISNPHSLEEGSGTRRRLNASPALELPQETLKQLHDRHRDKR